MNATKFFTKEDVSSKWFIVDAEGLVCGRFCNEIANVLRGKHLPTFTRNQDIGDHVVVINAEKVVFTGNKEDDKRYYWHSGYQGGLKSRNVREMRAQKPEDLIIHAVAGMLPKNALSKRQILKLHVYKGTEHPHTAQNPQALKIPKKNKADRVKTN